MSTRQLAIFVFPEVEVLDFAGPFEVFSVAGQRDGLQPFHVSLVAQEKVPVIARNGLSVNPHYSFHDLPQPDILLIPGGMGTRPLLENAEVIDWIRHTAAGAELVLSVCTGALLLGRAGLLDGLEATTHWRAFDVLRLNAPRSVIREDKRVVDNGKVVLSAGVSAGIDMSFHVIGRLCGADLMREAARYIEYPLSGVEPLATSQASLP